MSENQSDNKQSAISDTILLDDIKSPFETEAEETILKAIENAEKKKSLKGRAASTDRDNILNKVPTESLHLFGDDDDYEDVEETPNVFSLKTIDVGATHSKSSSRSRLQSMVKKVQLARNAVAPARQRVSSLESGEASLVYSTHSRIPSNIPIQTFPNAAYAENANNATTVESGDRESPQLFDIFEKMKTLENLTRENASSTRRNIMMNNQYVEIPTNVQTEDNFSESGRHRVDPESLVMNNNETINGGEMSEYPMARSKRDSSKQRTTTCLRRWCLPCFAFRTLMAVQRKNIKRFIKAFFFVLVPLLVLAFILFYFAGNPGNFRGASYSWWCLFAIRLGITLTLARVTEFILIDYIALETNITVRVIGRMLTLMLIQAKGWPILCVFWGIWNFSIVHGADPFANNWLYWASGTLSIFDAEKNPNGGIPSNRTYTVILATIIIIGVVIMVKRLLVSLLLGKKKYVTYGPKMEKIMRKVLLIAEVALLAEEIEFAAKNLENNMINTKKSPARGWLFEHYQTNMNMDDDEQDEDEEESMTETDGSVRRRKDSDLYDFPNDDLGMSSNRGRGRGGKDDSAEGEMPPQDSTKRKSQQKFIQWVPFKKSGTKKDINHLLQTKESELEKLLGEWEEPEVVNKISWADTSIRKILQFRESLKYLDGPHPLSIPFGLADTRSSCCKSAQHVYDRLLMKTPGASVLHFDTLSLLAVGPDGRLQKEKARALIRLFRPHRNGDLTKLDFVRSCDKIYRRARMFRAMTLASAQLDDAFEQLINIAFYVVTGFVVLVVVGFDLRASYSFWQGSHSDVGDRIAISDPQNDTSMDGSLTWFVENISLNCPSRSDEEVATYSNSSLAHSRIINAARSPKAVTFVYLKFGIDVPYSKVMICKEVVEKFVKDRPRQFLKIDGFRATSVEADLGYIKYVIILLHVDSWQNIGEVLQAKADVASFCLEVQKKMDMRYVAPPMPIDLSISRRRQLLPGEAAEIGLADFASTTSGEGPARSVFEQEFNGRFPDNRNDDLPPRIPTHVKNDSAVFVAPPMPIDLSIIGRKLLPGEAAEIGLADFASTTSGEGPTRSVFEQDFNGR
eukprot:CAMPEP_0176505866 /NCGR_PEP_ID=MMETSP0200_2-20121128/16732_1 /TAXON_ID=947934 /ORGANISM="Chaetoceros sp., Strain GSL56" /LENGTH=1081 /DNA_ID=CAMNT_0017905467 /DNA_START=263 /DNA_END=3505 /DNA_ORIENTATION=-